MGRTLSHHQTMAPTLNEQAAPAAEGAQHEEKKLVIGSAQGPIVKDAKAETEYAKNARGGGYNGGLVNFASEEHADCAANNFWKNNHTAFPGSLRRGLNNTPQRVK